MREQPHGAAKNSSTETRLLYVCLVIYTVCRLPCHLKCRIVFSENLVIGRHGSQQASLWINRIQFPLSTQSLLSGSPALLILYRRMPFRFCDTLPQKIGQYRIIGQERFASKFCVLTRRGFAVILDVLPWNRNKVRARNFRKAPQL